MRKGTVQSRQLAKEMMKEWFSQPQRDNDEGYALTAGPYCWPSPPALTTGPYSTGPSYQLSDPLRRSP